MKFTINVGKFLSFSSPVIDCSTKGTNKDADYFGRFKLSVGDDAIEVLSSTGIVSTKGRLTNITVDDLNLDIEDDGTVMLDGKNFINALSSFPVDTDIQIELKEDDDTKEIIMTNGNDRDERQTLVCFDVDMVVPKDAKSFKHEFSVIRDAFLDYSKKIEFAYGFEETREKFLYWVLRVNKDFTRFTSGTGGLFAILDIDSDNFISNKSSDKFDILFHKSHMPFIHTVLSKSNESSIDIKQTDPDDGLQIVISSNIYTICLTGMNPDIEWVNEQELLDKDYGLKIVTKSEDWDYACRGIKATHTEEMKKEDRQHGAKIIFDRKKDFMELKADFAYKAARKISVLDSKVSKNSDAILESAAYSEILYLLPKISGKDENIQLDFPFEEGKKPIVAHFYALDSVADRDDLVKANSATGFSEKFSIVFVQINLDN